MAVFYVDPASPTNGNGTSPLTPKNTWVGLTLTANNTYLQRRGTTFVGSAIRPQLQTSSAATPLTIGAYFYTDGSDEPKLPKPIIDHNGGTNGVGAIMVDTCVNVLVKDFAGTNSLGFFGAGIQVRRSVGVKVQRFTAYGNFGGVGIRQDEAAVTSVCTDVEVSDCDLFENQAAGIIMRWGEVSTAVLRRIKLYNNRVYRNGTGKTLGNSTVCGGIACNTVHKNDLDINYRCFDMEVKGNHVYDNLGYGINVEAFGNERIQSVVASNEVTGSGISLDQDSHSIWVGNCFGTLVEKNHVHHNYAKEGFTSGSGVGILIDYNGVSTTGGSGNVVRSNYVHDQFQGASSAVGASTGILVYGNSSCEVYSNIVERCRNGVGSAGVSGAQVTGNILENNTILSIKEAGLFNNSDSLNAILRNNIVVEAATGVFNADLRTTGFAETNNLLYKCALNKGVGVLGSPTAGVLDPSDSISNPLLDSKFKPTVGSPALSVGTPTRYSRRDFEGRQRITPCVGAMSPGVFQAKN